MLKRHSNKLGVADEQMPGVTDGCVIAVGENLEYCAYNTEIIGASLKQNAALLDSIAKTYNRLCCGTSTDKL